MVLLVLVVSAVMGLMPLPGFVHWALAADAAPTVDGNLDEWGSITKQASTDSDISYWQVAKDTDGNVYLAISGTASSQWVSWDWSKQIGSTINGSHQTTAFAALGQGWAALKGSYQQVNNANGNTAGPMYVEVRIDASSFKDTTDYSIDFAGTTVAAADIPSFSGSKPDDTPATYNGITIDGDFKDWDAVQKTQASDPNPAHPQNLAAAALVFDHDYAYIYIEEGQGGSAAGAGESSNGRFAITTDLGTGNSLMIQLHEDGQGNSTVTAGGQEVEAKHVGRQWEIAVPKSMLPSYRKTINFGLYLEDPIISGVANLDTSDNGNAGTFNGIAYDGDYSDWKDYPHTEIEYATSGTQEDMEDSEAALYSSNGMLFTHVKTTMPAHVQNEKGGEFLAAVTYDFGDGRLYYPNFAEVDGDGTIHWYSGGTQLSDGTHELYLFDTAGWNNSTNINNLTAGDVNYGRVMVTVKDGQVDEMESEIDLSKIAQKFNCDASDFKTIKAQFGRLGQQWVETAGTSTAPFVGVGLAVGSVVVAGGIFSRGKNSTRA